MNYRKKPFEVIPEENTRVWCCTKEGCNGWMRDNFTFETEPTCRLCSSPMVIDMKMLPTLNNSKSQWS